MACDFKHLSVAEQASVSNQSSDYGIHMYILRALSSQVWNTAKDEAYVTSVDNLLQSLAGEPC